MRTKISFFLVLLLNMTTAIFSQNTAGDNLFNNNTTHTIYVTFSQAGYLNLLKNNKVNDDNNGTSTYLPVTVIIDGVTVDSVGIQFKGNSSYYNYSTDKKPVTFSLDQYRPAQLYDSLNSINLNNFYQDATCMHEKLLLDFAQTKGLYAPRANYAKLYFNGTYWGLYLMVERINSTFLKDRFSNKKGNLFKGDGSSAACANLFYNSTISNYYNCYTLKTNTTTNDWTDLQNLTKQINNTSNGQFYDSLEAVMNTPSFIGAWAIYNLFIDFDSYPYRFVHNYYTYHNKATNKFEWIIWDASTAFGMDVFGTPAQIESTSVLYIEPQVTDRPLCKRMMANAIYKDKYLKTICSFATNDFLPSVFNPKIDALYNQIKNDVYADNQKMYSNSDFDTNINSNIGNTPGLKPFISNRSASVLAELTTLGYSNCSLISTAINEMSNYVVMNVVVFPNPTSDEFYINGNISFPAFLEIDDITGKKLSVENIRSNNQKISVANLDKGLYFYKLISNDGKQAIGKIIIN